MSIHVRAVFIGGCAFLAAIRANASFVINPTYDATILGNSAIKSTLDSAIAFYESTFTDNVSIDITFNSMNSGLGQSSSAIGVTNYSAIHNALIADSTSVDDAAALAQLNSNPFSGNIVATKANFRALGMSVGSFSSPDGIIGLNTGACFYGHANPTPGLYDLFAVACHEIDEVLGTGSGVGGSTHSTADLYRYDGFGARSFTTDNSSTNHVYFSINGSAQIVEYNQANHSAGDWGDWKLNSPPQVQDFQGTPGVVINPNNELRLLDVIGYNRASVPEPISMVALGFGCILLIRKGRRS